MVGFFFLLLSSDRWPFVKAAPSLAQKGRSSECSLALDARFLTKAAAARGEEQR